MALRKNGWIAFVKKHWLFFIVSIFISILFTSILIKSDVDAGGIKPYRGGTFLDNLLISFYAFLYNIKLLALYNKLFSCIYHSCFQSDLGSSDLQFYRDHLFTFWIQLFGL